jgi:hypothetical protein
LHKVSAVPGDHRSFRCDGGVADIQADFQMIGIIIGIAMVLIIALGTNADESILFE